jgi:hypothetical protein
MSVLGCVLVSLVSSATLLTAAFKLFERLVSHRLARELEREKHEWKANLDVKMESLKAGFTRAFAAYSAKISSVAHLFAACDRYGEAVLRCAGHGTPSPPQPEYDDMVDAIAKAGPFIGAGVKETISERIGREWWERLVAAERIPGEKQGLLSRFKQTDLPFVLEKLRALVEVSTANSQHPDAD